MPTPRHPCLRQGGEGAGGRAARPQHPVSSFQDGAAGTLWDPAPAPAQGLREAFWEARGPTGVVAMETPQAGEAAARSPSPDLGSTRRQLAEMRAILTTRRAAAPPPPSAVEQRQAHVLRSIDAHLRTLAATSLEVAAIAQEFRAENAHPAAAVGPARPARIAAAPYAPY
eukprot:TRINITY_DN2530_c0_g1_i1.p2 TRINITY_DN2530_c0_g1~~TRINITY_DN2530_c0_g1_i1.p2  ORF type:complete len:170 (+),score=47.72 TRINITY_DN2530_c0_g1_i1:404-913(+)